MAGKLLAHWSTKARAKLTWAFLLMSVVPLLVALLLAAWFAFPQSREAAQQLPLLGDAFGVSWWLWGLLGLTMAIAVLGAIYLTVQIINPALQAHHHGPRGADDREGGADQADDANALHNLAGHLQELTERVRTTMAELRQVGEQTAEINQEVQQHMIVLSNVLQIGELLSNGNDVESVLDVIVDKAAMAEPNLFAFLCLQPITSLSVGVRRAVKFDPEQLKQLVFESSSTVIDATRPPQRPMVELWNDLGRPNLVMQPVVVRHRPVGVLAVGNFAPGYTCRPRLVESVSVFANQVALALEHALNLRTQRALATRDELTGVYNEAAIRQRLEEEVTRAIACKRPCAIALFAINELAHYRSVRGEPRAEHAVRQVARTIQETMGAIDHVGRLDANEFVVVFPERNKAEATQLAEAVRQRVEQVLGTAGEATDRLTLTEGVAENPIDGATGDLLVAKARQTLANALERSQKNRVVC